MRHYECKCIECGQKKQFVFEEPYPEFGETFLEYCSVCTSSTLHTRVLTKKTASELRERERENNLRRSITDICSQYGFTCRFLYQSVIVTTQLSDWCFDYHEPRITLYHESTVKINFATGDYAKAHIQFKNRKMTPSEVVEYIAEHDARR